MQGHAFPSSVLQPRCGFPSHAPIWAPPPDGSAHEKNDGSVDHFLGPDAMAAIRRPRFKRVLWGWLGWQTQQDAPWKPQSGRG